MVFLIKLIKLQNTFGLKLKELENNFEEIVEVRGAGLLLGLKTKKNNLMIKQSFC